MATIHLPQDFKEFLRLLNSHKVRYLLVGGYAVGYHGYPRATADIDIWIAIDHDNAGKTVSALKEFGFGMPELNTKLFLKEKQVIRMGEPPVRIELLTSISGVKFEDCFAERIDDKIDGIDIHIISLKNLKRNKSSAGRLNDKADLEKLP